jgi:hypothetical protein
MPAAKLSDSASCREARLEGPRVFFEGPGFYLEVHNADFVFPAAEGARCQAFGAPSPRNSRTRATGDFCLFCAQEHFLS